MLVLVLSLSNEFEHVFVVGSDLAEEQVGDEDPSVEAHRALFQDAAVL